MSALYSTADAARLIGCATSTIRRHCIAIDIGRKLGRDRLLTGRDVRRLRKLVRPGPGNPTGWTERNRQRAEAQTK